MGDLPKLAGSRDVTGKVDNIHSNLTRLEMATAQRRDGADYKKMHSHAALCPQILSACCTAPHTNTTKFTLHLSASYLFFKFPQTSEKNQLSSLQHTKKLILGVLFWTVFREVALSNHIKLFVFLNAVAILPLEAKQPHVILPQVTKQP